jgi:hypothetical protein
LEAETSTMYDWWVPSLTAHPSSVRQTQICRGPQSYPQDWEGKPLANLAAGQARVPGRG